MRFTCLLIAGMVLTITCRIVCGAQTPKRQFQFEQYPTTVFTGSFHMPTGLHQADSGEWRDELGKMVDSPDVTFAGEYYLAGHSCGAGCRYYQLFNLRTGADLTDAGKFDAGEERPRTSDGHPYLTMLYYKSDSKLLIAEYHLDFMDPHKHETCRQQYFALEEGKLKAISKIYLFCTEDRDQGQ